MHHNYKLLILLGTLVLISVTLTFTTNQSSGTEYRVDLFQVADTSTITSITIAGEQAVKLQKSVAGQWSLNGKYGVNQNLKNILVAVLNQVTVRRPVSRIQQEEITQKLQSAPTVTIEAGNRRLSFRIGGNPARTQSYFMLSDASIPYIVEIPGYRNYISGLFELTEFQWRDRTLFQTHWRSLQSLKISYGEGSSQNLEISYQDDFFRVKGVDRMDTTNLMNYLAQFESFQANEIIPRGFNPVYDSLSETRPLATIVLHEINQDRDQELHIYPRLNRDDFVLTVNKNDELSLIGADRIRQLLAFRESFQAN